jgi:hypothetical protein
MNVLNLLATLDTEASKRSYILRIQLLEQTPRILKVRLHISQDLFIQVYRNDQFDTTSLALIYNQERIYARDQLSDTWHRHSVENPNLHDKSPEGSKPVNLSEFLDEVEVILAQHGLP